MASSDVQQLVYRLTAKTDELDRNLRTAQRKLSRFQKQSNTVTSAIRSQFVGMFGATAVLYGVQRLTSNTIDLVKRTDTLNKALTAVTGSEQELARSREFLSRISEEYGIEIENLTRSYTKFIASSKGTRLEGQQAEDIFMKVSKASAVMGLSVEETDGVLKALGQIMSKGKVQAEELRGQLGDRLPGAFNIMAQAIGVTTGELDKMLKDGKLMADDVLPAFADQMLKTYGADQVERVDTMVAAHNRFTNAWKELMQEVDSGEGVISEAYKGFFDILTEGLKALGGDKGSEFSLKGFGKEFEAGEAAAESFAESIKGVIDEQEQLVNWADIYQKKLNDPQLGIGKTAEYEGFLAKILERQAELKAEADATNKIFDDLQENFYSFLDPEAGREKVETLDEFIARMDSAAHKYKMFMADLKNGYDTPTLDYGTAQEGIRDTTPKDQLFDADVAAMMGLPPVESVDEYFEELREKIGGGWVSINEVWANGQKQMEKLTIDFGQMLGDVINTYADTIGSGGDIEDAFHAVLSMIGENMQQLGVQLLLVGLGIKAFQDSLATLNPFIAIGAGAALIAAGAAFKKKASDFASEMSGGGSSPGGFNKDMSRQTVGVEVSGQFRFNGRDFEAAVDRRIKEKERLGG